MGIVTVAAEASCRKSSLDCYNSFSWLVMMCFCCVVMRSQEICLISTLRAMQWHMQISLAWTSGCLDAWASAYWKYKKPTLHTRSVTALLKYRHCIYWSITHQVGTRENEWVLTWTSRSLRYQSGDGSMTDASLCCDTIRSHYIGDLAIDCRQ